MGLIHELHDKLAKDPLLLSIVSDRIDIGRLQQGRKLPAGVLYELLTEPIHALAGESGLSRSTIQVDWWADGADGQLLAKRCAYRVRDMFKQNFRGALVEGGLHCESVQVQRLDMLGERPADGSDNYLYRGSLDIEIVHEDPTADVAATLPLPAA